jgi:hypothetical protein
MRFPDLLDTSLAFLKTVHAVYGVYLDGIRGYGLVHKEQLHIRGWIIRTQVLDDESADSTTFIYGHGDLESPDAIPLHSVSHGELTARNEKGGENWIFLANVCLVSIYQYWEDRYRKEIAAALKKQKDDLRVPIMGDLRRYRRSIIHHAGIALPEMERCEALHWFGPGDRINLTEDQMREIVFGIYSAIVELLEEVGVTVAELLEHSRGAELPGSDESTMNPR